MTSGKGYPFDMAFALGEPAPELLGLGEGEDWIGLSVGDEDVRSHTEVFRPVRHGASREDDQPAKLAALGGEVLCDVDAEHGALGESSEDDLVCRRPFTLESIDERDDGVA